MERVRPSKSGGRPPRKTGFYPGHPKWGGRKKGVANQSTRILKDAILMAAVEVGNDGSGTEGLVGYLKRIALEEPRSFVTLLGKVMPLQITGDKSRPVVLELSMDKIAELPLDRLEALRSVLQMIDQGGAGDLSQLEGLVPRTGDGDAYGRRLN